MATQVKLPISGTYRWIFEIPGAGEQISTHKFSDKEIGYNIEGKAYTNSYLMKPLCYDENQQKIIAIGKGGIDEYSKENRYFVLFLKDITEDTVKLYKKECQNEDEAKKMTIPSPDDKENHGWNLYKKVD